MRIANITVYCEIFDVELSQDGSARKVGRKAIFPIEIATSDGEPVASNELARSIRAASKYIGVTPDVFIDAMLVQLKAESDTLSRTLRYMDGGH